MSEPIEPSVWEEFLDYVEHGTMPPSRRQMLYDIRDEVVRLQNGHFTPEEFQNLCHDKFPCSLEEFKKGCEEYQKKLFKL